MHLADTESEQGSHQSNQEAEKISAAIEVCSRPDLISF
jgi:hypothetical protein